MVARINDALQYRESSFVHKLTLISAPAGYGKTTLLSEWCRQSVLPIAWLSLDADDSNLPRFWSHVFAALRTAFSIEGQPILTELEATSPATVSAVLADWINQITQSLAQGVLILDDYHTIVEPSVHDSLAYWLEHCPTQLHLIITSRSDPPLPLSRLRGRGQLVEIRTADLRFATHETVVFLNQAMGLNLQTEYITSLETRTEGWIVGLQMAALSMHKRNREEISNFIDGFTGSHRFILDYLTDEVLLQQSETVQNFLLHTCILDR